MPVDGEVLLFLPPVPPSRREGGGAMEDGTDQREN
jgi:hypothetical protein